MGDKLEVAAKYINLGLKVSFVLEVCKIPRSIWYYHLKNKSVEKTFNSKNKGRIPLGYSYDLFGNPVLDSSLVYILKKFRESPEFTNGGGCKIIPHYLKRDYGIVVNHKKIYRLCQENKLLLPRNKKKINKNLKVCTNKIIKGPNQLWQFDIKYGYIQGENRFFYLLAFIDVFTKEVVNYHIGTTCKASDLSLTFEEALRKGKIKDSSSLVIRSDRGPQMTSNQFRDRIEDIVIHEFIPPRTPNKNAYIESFFSIFESEFLQVYYFKSYEMAYIKTVNFLEHYNTRRLHGSIKKLPPVEFRKKYDLGELGIIEVRA